MSAVPAIASEAFSTNLDGSESCLSYISGLAVLCCSLQVPGISIGGEVHWNWKWNNGRCRTCYIGYSLYTAVLRDEYILGGTVRRRRTCDSRLFAAQVWRVSSPLSELMVECLVLCFILL